MKSRNLFITIILGLAVISIASCSKMETYDQSEKGEDGKNGGGPRSFHQSLVTVTINETQDIEAYLAPNTGIIFVTINSSVGDIVYSKYVDTSHENQLYINISDIPAGSYTVYFADENNTIITENHFIID